jgi:hypothetical protein
LRSQVPTPLFNRASALGFLLALRLPAAVLALGVAAFAVTGLPALRGFLAGVDAGLLAFFLATISLL